MRIAGLGVCAALLILATAASADTPAAKDPKELILGKWVMTQTKENTQTKVVTELKASFDFSKDKVTMTFSVKEGDKAADEVTEEVKYSWVGNSDTIEMTAHPPKAKADQAEVLRIKVSEKELILSGKDGKDLKLTRPR